ncbi:MAG: hypothetical protein ABWY55_03925 [Microbacterium sp.]
MTDEQLHIQPRVARLLKSEEAIYGLILVSGLIVVANSIGVTSFGAFLTVVVTVLVFFAAHVYAGTLARLAATDGAAGIGPSIRAAADHSVGMLIISLPPLIVLALGSLRVVDDETAIWAALLLDTVLLAVLGWLVVARWTPRFWPRAASALITMAFGLILVLLKALLHH